MTISVSKTTFTSQEKHINNYYFNISLQYEYSENTDISTGKKILKLCFFTYFKLKLLFFYFTDFFIDEFFLESPLVYVGMQTLMGFE